MCTVVFIPGKDGYSFASLRDEDPMRMRAIMPAVYTEERVSFLSPLDPVGKGTWIGVNEYGNIIILLNGGFSSHIKKQNYAASRGTIVKNLLTDESPVIAWSMIDLKEIEPFTLIVWTTGKLFHLVWDGHKKHRMLLSNNIPHIFSSATLYEEPAARKKEELFNEWMNSGPLITAASAQLFFTTASPDSQNGFIINRAEKIKTLSYSFIEIKKQEEAIFNYRDLSTGAKTITTLAMQVNDSACCYI